MFVLVRFRPRPLLKLCFVDIMCPSFKCVYLATSYVVVFASGVAFVVVVVVVVLVTTWTCLGRDDTVVVVTVVGRRL